MYLPNRELAYIPEEKIVKYLLNLEHKDGGGKARFFLRFGFMLDNWEELAEALATHATMYEAEPIDTPSSHGVKYRVVGRLETPDGRNPVVRAIWMVPYGLDYPRLITAMPE